ncbi:MAG: hypothetical protein CMI08_15260 [Oceanospirillaceae bacterium]|nr:hypothetical protein [Oceanospirillaceae bacterium]MAY00527.1 hypothetical protein [Oceanospirillaceae bacterium]MBL35769.1 hypothetical protein [Oceanospirillaceae bacterium]MBS53856.1 hypothetical protein [Oceanospirillaceae bacterium]|tara:strand:- start:397 stop:753 length:357 start_codon:yes stop_codon:yes gene_type:complete
MNRKIVLKIIALLVLTPVLVLVSLVSLDSFENDRINRMCFSIEIGDSYSESMDKISDHWFIDKVEWTGDILKRLDIEGGLTHVESLLSGRKISCSIEHKDDQVVGVSTGSHFWEWLHE